MTLSGSVLAQVANGSKLRAPAGGSGDTKPHAFWCRDVPVKRASAAACITLSSSVLAQVANGGKLRVPAGGSGDTKPHAFRWRDAMDVLVKWRQLSEPNDQACSASPPTHDSAA